MRETVLDSIERIHSRTNPEDRIKYSVILQYGAGGIGSWIFLFNILQLGIFKQYIVVDPDHIEPHNLNRFPYPFWFIISGRVNKAKFLSELGSIIRPDIVYIPVEEHVNGNDVSLHIYKLMEDGIELDEILVIDATDNSTFSQQIRLLYNVDRVLAHYDGRSLTIEWYPGKYKRGNAWVLGNPNGYQTVPSLSITPALAGLIVTSLIIKAPRRKIRIQIPDVIEALIGEDNKLKDIIEQVGW